jgi:hypothetical protein
MRYIFSALLFVAGIFVLTLHEPHSGLYGCIIIGIGVTFVALSNWTARGERRDIEMISRQTMGLGVNGDSPHFKHAA